MTERWYDQAEELLQKELSRLKDALIGYTDENGDHHNGTLIQELERETETETSFNPNKDLYWAVVIVYIVGQLILLIMVVSFGLFKMTYGGTYFALNLGAAIVCVQTLHLMASFTHVSVDELAGFALFGRPVYAPSTGLFLTPWPFISVTKMSRNYHDIRFPGPPDKIQRFSRERQEQRDGGDVPDPGHVRPILVLTGEPRLTEEERTERQEKPHEFNPLDAQLSIEIAYFIRWRLLQHYGGIFRVMRNVGRGGSLEEKINDLMREQAERDIKAILTLVTPATAVRNWDLINQIFTLRLQLSLLRLGVQIDTNGAGLDDINMSHTTNEAQAEVPREKFRKRRMIIKAEGEREKRDLEGQGDANAERHRLTATAAGYRRIKEMTGSTGDTVIASETAQKALGRANTIVVGAQGGVRDLIGAVAAGTTLFGGMKGGESPSNTQDPNQTEEKES